MANTTWNPADKSANIALSNGNLTGTATGLGILSVRGIYNVATGKFYWECTFVNNTNVSCGITNLATSLGSIGTGGVAGAAYVNYAGNVLVNSASGLAALGAFANGSIACIALDLDNRLIWFRRGAAGTWNNSGTANPATATGGFALAFVGAGVAAYPVMSTQNGTNGAITANFGDTAFSGVAPAGYAAGFPGTVVAGASQARAMVLA